MQLVIMCVEMFRKGPETGLVVWKDSKAFTCAGFPMT